MCGIIGYSGKESTIPILLDGLSRLEYRGYDSAGLAYFMDDEIHIIKKKGRIADLRKACGKILPEAFCGIGHTRWATHGEPSDVNAHPHSSDNSRTVVVHNGIIENFAELKRDLIGSGSKFISTTDSEVCAMLLDRLYIDDPLTAIVEMIKRIKGSYALGMMFADRPGEIYAVRKDSPLIVGLGQNEYLFASDIPAILPRTKKYIALSDLQIVKLTADAVHIYNMDLKEINPLISEAVWDEKAAEKCGFDHYMKKEIFEQPVAVRNTVMPRIKNGRIDFEDEFPDLSMLAGADHIHIVACGSAMHAGLLGRHAFERLCRIPTTVDIASEFRYRDPIIGQNDMVILVSQSGETADTLAALRLAKNCGANTLAIVNVLGSSIAREANHTLFTHAGPEIAVATTKAYSCQVALLYMLAIAAARIRGTIKKDEYDGLIKGLIALPTAISDLLDASDRYGHVNEYIAKHNSVFFMGRRSDFAAAAESSLKLKEISYIHSEAYAAGEMKHGTISLIEQGTPVIAIATEQQLYQKMASNIMEIKARGGKMVVICPQEAKELRELSDFDIILPLCHPFFLSMLAVIPTQLIAYSVAVARGCDVDKPRNLAKSVTVE